MLTPHNSDIHQLIRTIRSELSQNRTDIQRLWRIAERVQLHPYFVSLPKDSGSP